MVVLARRTCVLVSLSVLAVLSSGCVPLVLYGPQTYYDAQTSAIVSPFKHVSVEYQNNGTNDSLGISFGDPNPQKLKNLRFASATMTNEDGVVTSLRLNREMLENPNSFRMEFYKADYLGHDLHFRVTVLSNGEPIIVTFQTRFKSKVVWPKDSDYSG